MVCYWAHAGLGQWTQVDTKSQVFYPYIFFCKHSSLEQTNVDLDPDRSSVIVELQAANSVQMQYSEHGFYGLQAKRPLSIYCANICWYIYICSLHWSSNSGHYSSIPCISTLLCYMVTVLNIVLIDHSRFVAWKCQIEGYINPYQPLPARFFYITLKLRAI